MAKGKVELIILPGMLGSSGWAGLCQQFARHYPGRTLTLHLRHFKVGLDETLREALRESVQSGAMMRRAPHLRLPEDDYAIRLTWKKGAGGG